ncbi:hypothetical protein MHK74_03835 [Microbacterium aurum]|nr:hypothetical protein [Microbacterium aurum]MCG7413720.1 hypothetical protein [Microbacterium aurum]
MVSTASQFPPIAPRKERKVFHSPNEWEIDLGTLRQAWRAPDFNLSFDPNFASFFPDTHDVAIAVSQLKDESVSLIRLHPRDKQLRSYREVESWADLEQPREPASHYVELAVQFLGEVAEEKKALHRAPLNSSGIRTGS